MLTQFQIIKHYFRQKFRVELKDGEVFDTIDFSFRINSREEGGIYGNMDAIEYERDDWFEFGTEDLVSMKPYLKAVEDMAEEDFTEYRARCKKIKDSQEDKIYIADTPASLLFMLEKGYDGFNLIESGQALRLEVADSDKAFQKSTFKEPLKSEIKRIEKKQRQQEKIEAQAERLRIKQEKFEAELEERRRKREQGIKVIKSPKVTLPKPQQNNTKNNTSPVISQPHDVDKLMSEWLAMSPKDEGYTEKMILLKRLKGLDPDAAPRPITY